MTDSKKVCKKYFFYTNFWLQKHIINNTIILFQNRYTDVLCYDQTRVVLSRDDNDVDSDYINANYVDGYKQKNAFISCQGPLPRTFTDMWQVSGPVGSYWSEFWESVLSLIG